MGDVFGAKAACMAELADLTPEERVGLVQDLAREVGAASPRRVRVPFTAEFVAAPGGERPARSVHPTQQATQSTSSPKGGLAERIVEVLRAAPDGVPPRGVAAALGLRPQDYGVRAAARTLLAQGVLVTVGRTTRLRWTLASSAR